MTNHEILQIKPGASKEEIKIAFRKLAHIHHPDKGGKVEDFTKIKNAYDYLMKGDSVGGWDMGFKTRTGWGGGSGFSRSTQKVYTRYNPTTGQNEIVVEIKYE